MGAEDTAFGAILEIPQSALDKIKEADDKIKALAQTSQKAANEIKTHWQTIAAEGMDAFIKKINAAKDALSSAGNISLNLKINENNISALSQSAATISEIAQRMSQLAPTTEQVANGMSKVSAQIKDAFPYEAGKNIDQLTSAIKKINDQLVNLKGGVPRREDEQYLVNLRDRYQQELNILNQSSRQKDEIAAKNEKREQKEIEAGERRIKAQEQRFAREEAAAKRAAAAYEQWWGKATLAQDAKTQTRQASEERSALAEQNRLLNERLKIQKQLSNLSIAEQKNTILGKEPLTADQMGLRSDLLTRIGQIDASLTALGAKYDTLSEKSRQAWDTRNAQSYIAWQQETIRYEEKLNQERVKANEIIANQAKGKLQPTTEELSVQRQLNSLYAQKLNIEKEIQQVNSQITLSGRTTNSAQQQYLSYLTSQTRALDAEITKVGQGYSKIAASAQDKYLQDWLRAQEKAAYDLAQAQERVNKARQSEDIATKLAQYKALVAENEKLTSSMRAYIKSAGQAPAPTDTSAGATAYRDMERQWQENEAKRRNISAQNIAEIVEYERQMRLKANQQAVSDFIQMQAQMTAEAKKAAQEQSTARQQAYQKYITSYEGAMRAAAKLSTGRQAGDYADTYENRARAIERLEKALKNLSKTDSRYEQKVTILTQKLNELKDKQEAVNNSLRRQPKQLTIVDAQRLRDIANAVQSLQSYEKAYKAVIDVMSRTQYGSRAWNEMNGYAQELKNRIDRIKRGMGALNGETQTASNNFSKLKNYVAAAFSVAAITGYIKKMVEVRAQFEMQQVALRAILQNKDEADRIFMQVQQMALQSPFSILQLTTYTKQLAAYRIEANKLVGTTKMLADVSAGLGVDIARLILAFGQVKSSNYLRACLSGDCDVLMYDFTYKKAKDIAVGDMLMGDDERPRFVSRLYQGEQMMYRVSYDGGEYRCNEHHILTAYDALTMRVVDVRVLDYLKEPHRYQGVRRVNGQFKTFPMKVECDKVDTYFGFSIDSNRRFIIKDNIVTHNTEIRQFTEAGLNIAGELSNYFSELQGRMVSVGEVMDMVTKRMVRFEDVEEVFKRVTSAGGLFYDMQRKQSETIAGQMQRIGDAYSIMLNEIGMANQGTIVNMLATIREWISNWREIAAEIKSAAFAMAAFMAVTKTMRFIGAKTIMEVGTGFKLLGQQIMTSVRGVNLLKFALKGIASTTGIGLIIAVLTEFAARAMFATDAMEQLNEELERIGGESLKDMQDAIGSFIQLANTISDATKTYTEHQEALDELKRRYKDILPEHKMQSEYIKSLNGDYRELTNTITQYYQSQEYQKKIEAVMGSDAYKDATEELKETGKRLLKDGLFDAYVTKSQVDAWMQTIADEIAQGKILNTTDAIAARIKEAFGTSLKGTQTAVAAYLSPVQEEFAELQETIDGLSISTADARDYLEAVSQSLLNQSTAQLNKGMFDLQKQREELEHQIAMQNRMADAEYNTTNQRRQAAAQAVGLREELKRLESQQETYNRVMAERVIEKYTANIKDLTANVNKQIAAYYELNKKLQTYRAEGRLTTEMEAELTGKMNESYNSAKDLAYAYGVTLERETLDAIDSQHKLSTTMQELTALTFPKLKLAAMDSLSAVERQMLNAGNSVNILRKAMQLLGSAMGVDFAQDLNTATAALDKELEAAQAVRNEIAQKYGVFAFDLDIERAGDESTKAYADRLRKSAEQDAQTVRDYQAAVEKGYADAGEVANGYSKEEIKRLDLLSKAREEYANKLYYHAEKERKTGGKDLVAELWKNRLKAIQDFYKRYEELRKKFNEAESQKQLKDSFRELFEQVELDMNTVMARGMNKKGFSKNLEVLLQAVKEIRPDLADEFAKAFADVDIQVRFELQDKQKEDFKKKVEDLFASMNLSQEFQKLGLPGDLTYMFGVEPINNIKQLRKEIEFLYEEFVDAGKLGTEGVQVYEDAIKKLNEMERKNQEERAKNYYKYLLESYSKGAQIQLKAQQEVNKIMASEQYDEWTKLEAKRNIMLKAQADQQKQMLQNFQSSDYYISIFSDLEHASRESLQHVITQLTAMKDAFQDMPVDQVRAIIKQIEAAQKAINDKAFFGVVKGDFKTYLDYLKKRNELTARANELSSQSVTLDSALSGEQAKLNALILARDSISKRNTEEYAAANDKVEEQQQLVSSIKKTLEQILKELGLITDEIEDGEDAGKRIAKMFDIIGSIASELAGAVGDAADAISNLTGEMSHGMESVIATSHDLLTSVGDMASGIGGIVASNGADIGSWAKAIGGLFKTLGTLFSLGDKKKEAQILRLREKVEDLDRAYQKLENTMERVYAFEDYVYGSKQLERNLREQLRSYEQMLELEKSKKKSDTATIREFEDAIEDLKKQLQDLADERTQALGGIGKNEWAEAAEDFMGVWYDAFKEQGDGLDALNDKWDDYLKNLIVKQATMRIVSKRLSGLFAMVDRAVSATSDQGEKLTRAELDELNKKRLEIMAALNGELKDLMEAWGIAGGQGELLLSDLQKGISNITEAQAAAIEAYLNSIRFAVYEHTNQLNQMLELLRAQYGANDNSPILTELRNIKNILSTISDNLNSVITYDNGQRKLRVR